MNFMTSNCNGNLPNSDKVAKFVAFLFTSNKNLQNFRCSFSALRLKASTTGGESEISFFLKGLKYPQISEPYRGIALIV